MVQACLPMYTTITSKNNSQKLILDSRGASVSSWSIYDIGILRQPEAPAAEYTGRHSASYHVPGFFGRIPESKIWFENKGYPVPGNPHETNAINKGLCLHGFGPTCVWKLVESAPSFAIFQTPENFLPADYPFPYTSKVTYSLSENSLELDLQLTAQRRGIYSLTWHPFFLRYIGDGSSHIQAKFSAEKVFPRSMVPMPETAPIEVIECWDYSSQPKSVIAPSDSSYIGWKGEKGVALDWKNIVSKNSKKLHNNSLVLEMFSPAANVLHIFTDLADSVCVEPSMSVSNGFWLYDQKLIEQKYAGVVLNEGETTCLKVTHSFQVQNL